MKLLPSSAFGVILSLSALHAEVRIETVATGFEQPTWIGHVPGDAKNVLLGEQKGVISFIDRTSGSKVGTFLDISDRTAVSAYERGFLGLAFAPDYEESGRLYVNLTNHRGDTEIIRFTGEPGQPQASSGEILLTVKQDYGNHNGGWIDFGPDGHLYIGMGDGGSADDPKNRAQDRSSLLGKMLRLDVSTDKGYMVPQDNPWGDEIWMTGLRNPWRCSFDPETGDLWIADVGQNKLEEVNFLPAGKGRGANFGWRLREGTEPNPKGKIAGDRPEANVDPIYEYLHDTSPTGGLSITGGVVHHGPLKSLQGHYVFADYQLPRLWSFKQENGKVTKFQNHSGLLPQAKPPVQMITTFGEDSDRNLYFADRVSGALYRLAD